MPIKMIGATITTMATAMMSLKFFFISKLNHRVVGA